MDPSHLQFLKHQFSLGMPDFEAFPNAEQLFRDAFALTDPAPELLKLIQTHPDYAAVMNLLVYYIVAVHENPSRANALALALVAVRDSDPPLINCDKIWSLMSLELCDLLGRGFDFSTKDRNPNRKIGIAPTNTYLLTSLLSGLSIKYDLCGSSVQYGYLWDCVDEEIESSTLEEVIVGACIQLLTSGSIIIRHSKPYIKSANEAVNKLKAQKSRGAVKDSNALRLLELTFSHAETGCKKKNDVDNVWELLFPS